MDFRWALLFPTVAAVFFVGVGYLTDGTKGLRDHYNALANNIPLYIVLAIAWITAICLAYYYMSRRPRRYVTMRATR